MEPVEAQSACCELQLGCTIYHGREVGSAAVCAPPQNIMHDDRKQLADTRYTGKKHKVTICKVIMEAATVGDHTQRSRCTVCPAICK